MPVFQVLLLCFSLLPLSSSISSHWTPAVLHPTDHTTSSSFYGTAVAVLGNTLLVSSPLEDVQTKANAGVVYSFNTADPDWSNTQRLIASDHEAGDQFGCSVAISPNGLFVLVGAKFHGVTDAGAAYLYYRTSDTVGDWIELTKLFATDGGVGDVFGATVALSNDYAVVAATGTLSNAGAVYVFQRAGTNVATSTWTVMPTVLVSGTSAANNQFGSSIAISNHVIAVGVPGGDLTGPARENAGWVDVFVLEANRSTWDRSGTPIVIDGAKAYDYTGGDVSVGPGVLLVASALDDHTELNDAGSVHSYTYNETLSQHYVHGVTSTVTYAFEQRLTLVDTTVSEVHNITCTATTGSFRLSLGPLQTAAIDYNDDLATVKAKLIALNSISDITVNILDARHEVVTGSSQTTMCAYPNPNGITVTYHYTSHGRGGAVPALAYVPIDLDVTHANHSNATASVVITVPTESAAPQDELHQSYDDTKFGESITMSPSGRFAAVGATHHAIGGYVNVYEYNASAAAGARWSRLHGINASSPKDTNQNPLNVGQAGHQFGGAVALDDHHLVVGAPKADVLGNGTVSIDRGTAFVYSLVPNAPVLVAGEQGTNRFTSIKWTIPFSNAAPILDYYIVATPVLGFGNTKLHTNASSIVVNTVNHTEPLNRTLPQEMTMDALTNLINGQAYNLTVRARSNVGSSLFSVSYGPLIPANVPDVPFVSTSLLTQLTAQSNALVQDQTIRVPVTLPEWNGGSGLQRLTVRLTAYDTLGSTVEAGVSRSMTRWINNTVCGGLVRVNCFVPGAHPQQRWWFNFTKLVNGMGYVASSKVSNRVGYSSETTTHTQHIVPASIPTKPLMSTTKIIRGNRNATVFFAPPAVDTGALLHYVVTVHPNDGASDASGASGASGAGENWTHSTSPMVLDKLNNGQAYQFVVRAYNWMGMGPPSTPSLVVVPADVPDPVADVVAVPGDMNATVRFFEPRWDGGSAVLSYTMHCVDDQGLAQPSVTTAVDQMSTVPVATTFDNGTARGMGLMFTHTFSNAQVPLVNGRKYTLTVTASNDVGDSVPSSQLCWPKFNGLRDWEIVLLVVAPLSIVLFVLLYVWRCKHRNPLTCKPIKTMKRAAVAPAPVVLGAGGAGQLELGAPPKAPPPPLSFLNMGLDSGTAAPQASGGGYGGPGMFDALRSGQAVHVAQKRNAKRRDKKKGGKRRQL